MRDLVLKRAFTCQLQADGVGKCRKMSRRDEVYYICSLVSPWKRGGDGT